MTHTISTKYSSPNHSSRGGADISIIVLHATVGGFYSSLKWLTQPASRVSCHYLFAKNGGIYQLVPDSRAAWHAGVSTWRGLGRDQIQAGSIGIELTNDNDGRDPYPKVQLEAAQWLCKLLIERYQIDRSMFVRHLDIAVPKGRKTDPAGFPWTLFVSSLYDPPPVPRAYRVKQAVTAGAVIRSAPRTNAAVLGKLAALDPWVGVEEQGQKVTLAPFGTSDIWIRDAGSRYVWSGLLETV